MARPTPDLRIILSLQPLACPLLAANTLNACIRQLEQLRAALGGVRGRPFPVEDMYDELQVVCEYVECMVGPAASFRVYDWTSYELVCAYLEFMDKADVVRQILARRIMNLDEP
ncbi:hypothetical protein Q5752_000491 [Cryptotrichosporon argae]